MSNSNEYERLWKLQTQVGKLVMDRMRDPSAVAGLYQRILEDKDLADAPWYEENGFIHTSVTSDGTTGEQWVARLEGKRFHVSVEAKEILRSSEFRATYGVRTHLVVMRGSLFKEQSVPAPVIHAMASKSNFIAPIMMEDSCLLRERLSDKDFDDMGLESIRIMHEPVALSRPTFLELWGKRGARLPPRALAASDIPAWSGASYGFAVGFSKVLSSNYLLLPERCIA